MCESLLPLTRVRKKILPSQLLKKKHQHNLFNDIRNSGAPASQESASMYKTIVQGL
jgi:hypothetical protein